MKTITSQEAEMVKEKDRSNVIRAAELFWEAIPPIWYILRSQLYKTAREEFDITGGQFHVLQRIKNGDTSVSELADAHHISRPVVSRKLDNLVEKGLVSRKESPQDRRFTVLELTPEGEKILEVLSTTKRKWLEEPLGSLTDQELETVIEGFSTLMKISN